MRRHEFVDDLEHFRGSGVGRLIQEIDETGRQEEEKRNGSKENVERDSTREEKNIILAAVVPDPLRIIAKEPTEPGCEPALRH
jgi:hypothetical protein